GGATTSEIHTAVKIDPQYSPPVIHVRDASRCIGVLSNLFSATNTETYVSEVKEKHAALRFRHENKKDDQPLISLQEARQNKMKINWKEISIPRPSFTGIRVLSDYPLEELRKYIDWTFFFHAWKMSGKYPDIFEDPVKGEEAKKLFDDAGRLMDEIISDKMLIANGVFGLFPAQAMEDDILVYADESGEKLLKVFHFLRNQEQKRDGVPNLSLADFIAPKDSGIMDYIGFFAVTAGTGIEAHVKHFEAGMDDYKAIMLKILSDRFAEAFAERMHERVRKEFWGYAKSENLSVADVLKEGYQGIRPAPGYPACPEHSEKRTIFDMLDVEENAGITMTENFAIYPAASVCGYYFSHEFSKYFNLGKISEKQAEDYAKRKKIPVDIAKKYLRQNIIEDK
ncbi:MAG: methionine synthase, partial [Bacteroidales bacterium]|nr:methionine synthase [Bacteroidales bacterium]